MDKSEWPYLSRTIIRYSVQMDPCHPKNYIIVMTSLLESGDYGAHTINEDLTKSSLQSVHWVLKPLVMPKVPEYIIIVDLFGIMSLANRIRAITVRLWNSSQVKTVNQSITIHHILNRGPRGGVAEINATTKDLHSAKVE